MTIASAIANTKYFFQHELKFYTARLSKKYYIIRRSELGAGFFSNYYWVMGHVMFAKKLGYIPVVDMENYPTLYSEDEPIDGVTNAWNYYFDNVGAVSLEEAYASNKYVLGEIRNLHKYTDKYTDPTYRFPSKRAIDYYHSFIEKNIRIRADIQGLFKAYYDETIFSSLLPTDKEIVDQQNGGNQSEKDIGRIIGVHIRGTDMKNNLGHPMPADTSKYIEALERLIATDKTIRAIYLATDEKSVVDGLAKAIDNINEQRENNTNLGTKIKLLYQDAFRSDIQTATKLTGIHEQHIENPRDNHKYRMGLEVLQDAWILSKSDYLVCGYSNITNMVLIWNNNRYIQTEVVR